MANGKKLYLPTPLNGSKTSADWKQKQTNIGNDRNNGTNGGSEQAGGGKARWSTGYESTRREVKRQATETGNQEVSEASTKQIAKQEEKKQAILHKYSKDNLLKSVKQKKQKIMATQQANYMQKVST